jgi:hypothetical protein
VRPATSISSVPPRSAWFDAPYATVFYPPNPFCQIVAHGASPAGIAEFELSVNGETSLVTAARSGGSHVASLKRDQAGAEGTLATLTRDCGVTDPGVYRLRIRAHDNAGAWSNYAETHFIIAGVIYFTPAGRTAATPTFTPAPALTGGASIESISDDAIYAGDDSGPTVTIVAGHITRTDQVVVLFFRYERRSRLRQHLHDPAE